MHALPLPHLMHRELPPRRGTHSAETPPFRPLQMAHDEGACYMPSAIYNTSIVLTHWGRLDRNHTSNSAYLQVGGVAGEPGGATERGRGTGDGGGI